MQDVRLGAVEARFADIVWNRAPMSTRELVEASAAELSWKRTTTYTVLKKLCERGLFETKDSTVTVLVERDEFYAMQSEKFVEDTFEGSLPAFLAAFSKRKKYTSEEVERMKQILDSMKGEL